jgi:MoaA/NifB/PqqE/SkfB family radical SAM enzyme
MNIIKHGKKILGSQISYLIYTVTARCDAFCPHCWNWENVKDAQHRTDPQHIKRHELTLEEIDKLSQKLNLLLLNLCGGEPHVREDLSEIIKIFNKNSNVNYITIPSNGFNTDRIIRNVKTFCEQNPNIFFRLGISLDGLEEQHDKIRSYKGGFKKALKTAKELHLLQKDYKNFSVGADILFSGKTQNTIEDLYRFLHNTSYFDQIDINLIRGNPYDKKLLETDIEKYKSINNLILAERVAKTHHPHTKIQNAFYALTTKTVAKASQTEQRVFNCHSCQKFAVLDDQGEVFPCEIMFEKSLGNLRNHNYDLHKLINDEKNSSIITSIQNKECACTWDCAINLSWVYSPSNYPKVLKESLKY